MLPVAFVDFDKNMSHNTKELTDDLVVMKTCFFVNLYTLMWNNSPFLVTYVFPLKM